MTLSTTLSPETLRRWRRRVFAVSWLSYAGFYLGRVNLAVAIPALGSAFGWSRMALGLLGSAFFWVYAFSQLLNGYLGDRLSARRFVAAGLLLSAGLNLLVGSLGAYGALTLAWAANGWAQATGWGPIMRTLARWFPPDERGKLTALFAPCYVVGSALSWAVAGWFIALGGWRWAFWGPGMLLWIVAFGWFIGVRDDPQSAMGRAVGERHGEPTSASLPQDLIGLLRHARLAPALAVCLFSGMIKDGLTLWGPTYLMEQAGLSLTTAALSGVIIPIAGAAGVFFAGWAMHRHTSGREMPVVAGLAILVTIAVAGLYAAGHGGGLGLGLTMLAAMALGSHGTNALLLASLPLSLGPRGAVSAAAGTLDFISYVGGGISALLVGWLQDLAGWPAVHLWWGAVALAMVILAVRTAQGERTQEQRPARA
ncbi:MAG: MFS transporter [Chloroflexi bacterium]|nr:MFS transporter [Chloroflexota bacterium]